MQFEDLDSFFENALLGIPLSQLKSCIEEISSHYRENKFFIIKNKLYALSYALARLPATRAAIEHVLSQIPASLLENIEEVIDLGSGPGTFLSAASYFPELKSLHLVEKNPHFLSILKELTLGKSGVHLHEKDFLSFGLENALSTKKPSAILASYSLGEIAQAQRTSFFQKLLKADPDLLICIEPGTPKGFGILNEMRTLFLKESSYSIVAPCSHVEKCPLAGLGIEKWCHFSVRLQRTKYHKFLKGGSLGYEDEKISYLVFSKSPVDSSLGKRILGAPRMNKAAIELELCTPNVVERLKLLPSNPSFKKAKKLRWGDLYF